LRRKEKGKVEDIEEKICVSWELGCGVWLETEKIVPALRRGQGTAISKRNIWRMKQNVTREEGRRGNRALGGGKGRERTCAHVMVGGVYRLFV